MGREPAPSPVFDLGDHHALDAARTVSTAPTRTAMERALDTATWLDHYHPTLRY
ncbi:hypothetical protein [Streptomyces luteolus]|uniref:Uncharacterized protein n=1 Tax=Streptomyces luteolus TaxID=3043615 RepID=A0ABT6SZ76_9ACTN|nr:hypothetical protein [Streptomyces sp. B-S-A12]MDI3420903.1 hypothetical protein [Streptomyces sp. B-S-A12]